MADTDYSFSSFNKDCWLVAMRPTPELPIASLMLTGLFTFIMMAMLRVVYVRVLANGV